MKYFHIDKYNHYCKLLFVVCRIFFVTLFAFAMSVNMAKSESLADSTEDNTQEVKDSDALSVLRRLADNAEESIGTMDCFSYLDSMSQIAASIRTQGESEHGEVDDLHDFAITQKASNYLQMGMFQEGVDFVESAKRNILINYNLPWLQYIGILCRIEMGHYKLALNSATELYEQSKNSEIEQHNDGDRKLILQNARTKSLALICAGYANQAMEEYDKAINNFSEAVDAIEAVKDIDFKHELAAQQLDPQTYLMELSEFVKDPVEALGYVQRYEKQLNHFRNLQKSESSIQNVFTDDYLLYMYTYYGQAYIRLNDTRRTIAAFNSADSVLALYDGYMTDAIMADYYAAKAKYYDYLNRPNLSVAYSDSAANAFQAINKPVYEARSLVSKMDGLYKLGVIDQIYPIAKRIIELKDSVTQQKINSNNSEMQTQMGLDKAEKEKADLEQRRQILEQRQRFYIMLAVAVLLIALLVIFWLRHRATQKEKAILAQQKELLKQQVDEQTKELREQKDTIEAANRSITDSITYALHIQQAILPSFDIYAGNPGQPSGAFCFYQPCHIVSGDFYWAAKRGNNTLYACCDCTGHGVPGGFMSMLGTSVLAEAAKTPGTENNLAELLEVAHEQLLHTLEQSGDKDSRDGMDMAVIEYNPDNSTVTLASANRTSMLFINGEWIQHKGVKRGIGERSFDRNSLPFQIDVFDVKKGDRIFLFSDGYPDQFGGPRNKKIGNKGVTAILEQTATMPYDQLYQFISDKYWEWRGDCEQLDDISMLCVEI